jgi:hypothetical protein
LVTINPHAFSYETGNVGSEIKIPSVCGGVEVVESVKGWIGVGTIREYILKAAEIHFLTTTSICSTPPMSIHGLVLTHVRLSVPCQSFTSFSVGLCGNGH